MPCSANDNSIDVTAPPPQTIPGIGAIFAPTQNPIPELDLPTDLVEDVLALSEQLGALFPSGLFKANPDYGTKNVLDFIANILSQLAPFLSFYNFIMALLNIIICVIEVLCAIPNPFAIAAKLKKLFTECLPPFLQLFPWLALLAMILSLLLLILALILYIVEQIIAVIQSIIENVQIFTNSVTLQDSESVVAAANKIASLLCFIENIMAIFIAIAAILAIIKALASFAGGGICSSDDSEGCCPPEICPSFLRDFKEINVTSTGQLRYFRQIDLDVTGIPGIPAALATSMSDLLEPIRIERWQLWDTNIDSNIPINLIITPTVSEFYGESIFFPDQDYTAETLPNRAPYTVDINMTVDPSIWHSSDFLGEREIIIKDAIVVRKPYNGLIPFSSNIPVLDGTTGTFNIEGGLVFESDGETPFLVNGSQASLNNFIHLDNIISTDFPSSDDGYNVIDLSFTWKSQHPVLVSNDLITVGCLPEISLEKAVQNNIILSEGAQSILERIPAVGDLGDNVTSAVQCVQNAISKFRESINAENAALFQAEVETCLNRLANQVRDVYCQSLIEGVSNFKSSFSINDDVQFISRPIDVNVILRDAGGTIVSNNIPEECVNDVLDKLSATVTFGEVGEFEYNRESGSFISKITADSSGIGELQILFDNQIFSTIIDAPDFATPTSIEETKLSYEFIAAVSDKAVERDLTDISGDS